MARPTKLNQKTIDIICKAMELGSTRDLAAQAANVHVGSLYGWMAKGRKAKSGLYFEFFKRLKKAESNCALRDLSVIQRASKEGDWKASAWRLERRFGYIKNMNAGTAAPAAPAVDLPTDPKELMIMQLQDLRSAMAKAQASESWQAYAALQRQMLRVMAQLKLLAAEDGTDALQIMTDEQLIAEITQAVVSLPPVLRQRLESQLFELSNVVSIKG